MASPNDPRDNVVDQLKSVADKAQTMASDVAEQANEARDSVGKVAGNFQTAMTKSIKDQPMATVLVAAAMAFVLGALWKS